MGHGRAQIARREAFHHPRERQDRLRDRPLRESQRDAEAGEKRHEERSRQHIGRARREAVGFPGLGVAEGDIGVGEGDDEVAERLAVGAVGLVVALLVRRLGETVRPSRTVSVLNAMKLSIALAILAACSRS